MSTREPTVIYPTKACGLTPARRPSGRGPLSPRLDEGCIRAGRALAAKPVYRAAPGVRHRACGRPVVRRSAAFAALRSLRHILLGSFGHRHPHPSLAGSRRM